MHKTLHHLMRGLAVAAVIICPAAEAASTSVSQAVTPGLLTLTSPSSATLETVQTDLTSDQTTYGELGYMDVADSRGTATGWSLTATASDFTKIDQPIQLSGSGGSVTTSGTYTGDQTGSYIIQVSHTGGLGGAQITVSGLESSGPTTISLADVPIGTSGVVAHFGFGDYTIGEEWVVNVGTIPAANLTITPQPSDMSVYAGSTAGVEAGSGHNFSGTSDSATIMTAAVGAGDGWYGIDPFISLVVPADTRSGDYTATITETVD